MAYEQQWSGRGGVGRVPALLSNPGFYGTLAATRALGENGVPVYVAGDSLLDVSRWSRFTARALTSPSLKDPDRFLDWLGELGHREPGMVLYPTSDDATFLYALRGDELARDYRMYQPGLATILRVLDKKRLYAEATAAGLEVPQTWFPETDADVERIAREAPMPLLLKPRAQVLSLVPTKGIVVTRREDLLPRYREFVRSGVYAQALLDHVPDAAQAMIQVFLPNAADSIYVLAAFTDREGSLFAARSGVKIFQRPRRLGIGLCFEDARLEPSVCTGARELARRTGYFGIFQLEFVRDGDRFLMIDFNPRFYNQLAFDMARGLPLPGLAYAAACGDATQMASLIRGAETPPANSRIVYCNEFGLNVLLSAQRLSGRISADEADRWRRWREEHCDSLVDPAVAAGDTLPAVVDVLAQIYACARHPRSFVRQIVQDEMPARATSRWLPSRGSA
jgi:D-aspartate ligase